MARKSSEFLHMRITPEAKARVQLAAERQGVSISAVVVAMIESNYSPSGRRRNRK